MTLRLASFAIGAVALITLSGCAASPSAIATAQPTASRTAHPTASPAAADSGDDSTQQSQPTHALAPAAAKTAAKIATTVMSLYARPSSSAESWIAGLDPYLTQDAAAAFAGTDPSTIPAHQVTGTAQILPASTAEGALVDVPTDAGTYQLLLLKNGSGWLVDQIIPPKS